MIEKLTSEQKAAIAEYRERYFAQAISTERADRPRAETAARELAGLAGVKVETVRWACRPDEVNDFGILATLMNQDRYFIGRNLCDLLPASISRDITESAIGRVSSSIHASLRYSVIDALWLYEYVAYLSYAVEQLGVNCSPENQELIRLYNEVLSSSFFAVYIAPETLTLYERPTSVEVEDGKLTGVRWVGWEGGKLVGLQWESQP